MQPCPRQSQEATLSSQLSHQSHWREDDTCSYCGSLSPDAFFKAIEEGCELGPTDKNYKVYVDLKEPHPDELRVVSAITFDPGPERVAAEKWLPVDPVLMKRDGWRGSADYKFMLLAPRGSKKFGKFYFQHLSKEECHKFIDLMNTHKVKVGAPGYFYVLPFFCQRIK